MKITTEPREDCQVHIIAEFDSEILQQYKRHAARKIAQKARIPGFRPGKAPYDLVKRFYGDEAIQSQALELIVNDFYPKVLEEAKIEPSGSGTLENIISQDPPTLSFIVPLQPQVSLCDYRAIRKDYQPDPVTDKDVERVIESLQWEHAIIEPAERPASLGDQVYLKISGIHKDPAEGEDPVLIKETSHQVVIGRDESENSWPYPGFSQELIGLSANEEKTVDYTYPEDAPSEKLRGKSVEFHIAVRSVKSVTMPELNDDFAKTVGDYESIEGLRATIRTNLEKFRMQEYDQTYLSDLINQIVEQSSVKYPPHILDHQVERLLHEIEDDLKQQNMDLQAYFKMRNIEQDEFIENEVRPAARRRVERMLILEEIAKKEDIRLQEDELKTEVSMTIQNLTSSPEFNQYRKGTSLENLTRAITLNTANRLFNQHLMERLKAIATGAQEAAEATQTLTEIAETTQEASPIEQFVSSSETADDSLEQIPTGENLDPAVKDANASDSGQYGDTQSKTN